MGFAGHDSQVIAALLALARYREKNEGFTADVVSCFMDEANRTPARVAAKYPVTLFNVRELLARVMLQVSRQPGLFSVLSTLLQFDGDEIYYVSEPRFTGQSFGSLAQWYPDSMPIGLVRNGVPSLLPDAQTVVAEGDEIIFITEDDDTAMPHRSRRGTMNISSRTLRCWKRAMMVSRSLFTDWAPTIPDVLLELDRYLMSAHNSVTIIIHPDDAGQTKLLDVLEADQRDGRAPAGSRGTLDPHSIGSGRYSRARLCGDSRAGS